MATCEIYEFNGEVVVEIDGVDGSEDYWKAKLHNCKKLHNKVVARTVNIRHSGIIANQIELKAIEAALKLIPVFKSEGSNVVASI